MRSKLDFSKSLVQMSREMTSSPRPEASKRLVEETKRLYANLLARELSEKQLARPTFKFIQEIVKSVSDLDSRATQLGSLSFLM